MTTEVNAEKIRRAVPDDVTACATVVHNWARQTDWMPEELPVEELSTMIGDAFDSREIWVAGDPVDCYMSVDPALEHKVGALYCGAHWDRASASNLLDKAKEGRDHLLWLTTHMCQHVDAQRFYRREGL